MSAAERLAWVRAGLVDLVEWMDGMPCSFWACPGPDVPVVPMATCSNCGAVIDARAMLAVIDA